MSKGGNWTKTVYLYDFNNPDDGFNGDYTEEEILENIDKFKETVENVEIYKVSLYKYQLTRFLFNHQYVVIKCEDSFWSIEKNGVHILIQKSRIKEDLINTVLSQNTQSPKIRNRPKVKDSSKSEMSLADLIRYVSKFQLKLTYHVRHHNCKRFAREIFKRSCNEIEIKFFLEDQRPIWLKKDDIKDKIPPTEMSVIKIWIFLFRLTRKSRKQTAVVVQTVPNFFWSFRRIKDDILVHRTCELGEITKSLKHKCTNMLESSTDFEKECPDLINYLYDIYWDSSVETFSRTLFNKITTGWAFSKKINEEIKIKYLNAFFGVKNEGKNETLKSDEDSNVYIIQNKYQKLAKIEYVRDHFELKKMSLEINEGENSTEEKQKQEKINERHRLKSLRCKTIKTEQENE